MFGRKKKSKQPAPPKAYDRGDYQIGDQLGKGGAGTVFKMSSETGPDLAVKKGGTANLESGILDQLGEHKNIIKKVDSSDDELVMELMAQGSLASVEKKLKAALDDGKISWTDYIGAIQHMHGGALEGLAHMDEKGMTHGDIKPQNMGLGHDMDTRLFDFDATKKHGEAKPHWTMGYSMPQASAHSGGDTQAMGNMSSKAVTGANAFSLKDSAPDNALNRFARGAKGGDMAPSEALKQDFFTDRLLDEDSARNVLRNVLDPQEEEAAAPKEVVPGRDDDTKAWDKKAHKQHKKAMKAHKKNHSRKQRKRTGGLLDEIRGFDKSELKHVEANSGGAMSQLSDRDRDRMLHPESHWSEGEDGEVQRAHRKHTGKTKEAKKGNMEGWWSTH